MQDEKKRFVRALSSLLSYRGLSQRELADKIGCTESAVSAWLNGKSSPTQKRLHKIAEVLNVDVAYLLGSYNLFDEEGVPNFEPDPIMPMPTPGEAFEKAVSGEEFEEAVSGEEFEGAVVPMKVDYFSSDGECDYLIEASAKSNDAIAAVDSFVEKLRKYSELINKWEKLSDKERDNVMSYIDFNLSEEGK